MSNERKNESDERKKEDEEEEIPLTDIKIQRVKNWRNKFDDVKKMLGSDPGNGYTVCQEKIWAGGAADIIIFIKNK